MSVKAMTWVFEHSPYLLGTRLVHLAIADVVNDTHENQAWLRNEDIASKANMSVRQVQRAIRSLVNDGELVLVEAGGGRGKPSVYRLMLGTGEKGCQSVTVSSDKRVTSRAKKGDKSDTERVTSATSHLSLTQEEQTKGTQRARATSHELLFARCWEHYPRKLNRTGAFKAFVARLRAGADPALLELATRNYAEQRRGEDASFTLHGSTFYGPNDRWREFLPDGAGMAEPRHNGNGHGHPNLLDSIRAAHEVDQQYGITSIPRRHS